jgi:hypothetical protein
MKTTVTFNVDTESLGGYTDSYLVQLHHIAQANPAAFGDKDACALADAVKDEIVRRWLNEAPVELWSHKGGHVALEQCLQVKPKERVE